MPTFPEGTPWLIPGFVIVPPELFELVLFGKLFPEPAPPGCDPLE